MSDLVKDVKIMADFTVAAPFAKSYVKKAAQQTGHAAATATKRKNDKYKEVCKQVKVLFKPLAMEPHGFMSDDLDRLIKLAQEKISNGPSPLAKYHGRNFTRYWRIQLSVEFMKATAESVLVKIPFLREKYKEKYSPREMDMLCRSIYPGQQEYLA